jgi:hypothetical protein
MITQPSCSRLLEVIREELRSKIVPSITDPALAASLGMVDSLLQNVSARCDHEVAWMREEVADIERAADRVVASGADADHRVAEAIAGLRANRSPSDHTDDVRAEYILAGEVLSRSLECALRQGDDVQTPVVAVLRHRLDRELEIRGDFSLVGR